MKASKALTVSVSVFRGRISWRFSLSKNNIFPAAPDLELILFPLWYWPVMNAHTKQQEDSVWNIFYWQSKIWPHICAPFGTKSINIITSESKILYWHPLTFAVCSGWKFTHKFIFHFRNSINIWITKLKFRDFVSLSTTFFPLCLLKIVYVCEIKNK